jgi:exonuclease III
MERESALEVVSSAARGSERSDKIKERKSESTEVGRIHNPTVQVQAREHKRDPHRVMTIRDVRFDKDGVELRIIRNEPQKRSRPEQRASTAVEQRTRIREDDDKQEMDDQKQNTLQIKVALETLGGGSEEATRKIVSTGGYDIKIARAARVLRRHLVGQQEPQNTKCGTLSIKFPELLRQEEDSLTTITTYFRCAKTVRPDVFICLCKALMSFLRHKKVTSSPWNLAFDGALEVFLRAGMAKHKAAVDVLAKMVRLAPDRCFAEAVMRVAEASQGHGIVAIPDAVREIMMAVARRDIDGRMQWNAALKLLGMGQLPQAVIEGTTCTCHMGLECERGDPVSMMIWNGNGLRRRWSSIIGGLKQVVEAKRPEILIFLEAKTDWENLMKQKGFEDWVRQQGYGIMYLYWTPSTNKSKNYGQGGVFAMVKRQPEAVSFGTDDAEDKTARVMTLVYPSFVVVASYNPQGGLSEDTMSAKTRWETRLEAFLQKTKQTYARPVVWAGDFNVNPYPDDWSEKAFEFMRRKGLGGKTPPGCRPIDVERYNACVKTLDGVNVGEMFEANRPKTHFGNDKLRLVNAGQRIDHIVAAQDMTNGIAPVQFARVETLQAHGGFQGSSDHCPLWCEFVQKVQELCEDKDSTACHHRLLCMTIRNPVFVIDEREGRQWTVDAREDPLCTLWVDGEPESCFTDTGSWFTILNPMPDHTSSTDPRFGKLTRVENASVVIQGVGGGRVHASEVVEISLAKDKESEAVTTRGIVLSKHDTDMPRILLGRRTLCCDLKGFASWNQEGRMEIRFAIWPDKTFDCHATKRMLEDVKREASKEAHEDIGTSEDRVFQVVTQLLLDDHERECRSATCRVCAKITHIFAAGDPDDEDARSEDDDEEDSDEKFAGNPLPILRVEVASVKDEGKITVKALVDSGASINLISARVASTLGLTLERDGKLPRIVTADGTVCEASGRVLPKLWIAGQELPPSPFFVLNNLPFDLLIGNQGCRQWDVSIDWSTKKITFGSQSHEVRSHRKHWQVGLRLRAKEETKIAPHATMRVKVELPCLHDGYVGSYGLITGLEGEEGDLRVIGGAGTDIDEVVVMNMSEATVSIAKDEDIAVFHPRNEEDFQRWNPSAHCTCAAHRTFKMEEAIDDWEQEMKSGLLSKIDLKHLSKEEYELTAKMLIKHRHTMSDGTLDYVANPAVQHQTTCEIRTTVDNPRLISYHGKATPDERKEQAEIIQKYLEQGIIEPSKAPWSSSTILVRKDGKIRLVMDYRGLNKVTIKDAYPMPTVQQLTDCLQGSLWLTTVDCVQAFHQIPMDSERAKDLTTFRSYSGGLYRFRFMPFGLTNAMAVWCRFIDSVVREFQYDYVLCYADDILIYTKSSRLEDHLRHVDRVFARLAEFGLKVKATKIKIACHELPFLGVLVGAQGMRPNPEKTKAIKELQVPRSVNQLRRILGMFSYYRKFIAGFGQIAAPLYAHVAKGVRNKRNDSTQIVLSEEAMTAFEKLKAAITSDDVMIHYPDWNVPFEIHCDASQEGVAAILCQNIEGRERVVMYASRALTESERKYMSYEQECLAVVWAVELFRQYIQTRKTLVRTDCDALRWLKGAKEGSRVMRWWMRLQEFDLEIVHRKGKNSANVDALTRENDGVVCRYGEEPIEELSSAMRTREVFALPVMTRGQKAGRTEELTKKASPKKTKLDDGKAVPATKPREEPQRQQDVIEQEKALQPEDVSPPKPRGFFIEGDDIKAESRGEVIEEQKKSMTPFMVAIRGKANEVGSGFAVESDGLLVKVDNMGDKIRKRWIIPESLRAWVLWQAHNIPLKAHQGRTRIEAELGPRVFWPRMTKDIRRWVKCCSCCIRRKTPRPMRAGFTEPVLATFPNQILAIDIVGKMVLSEDGNLWMLTMIDPFTRWPVVVPIPNRTSEVIAEAIYRYWICEKSVPRRILSDQGRELVSKGVQRLCDKLGISRVHTGGYNPTGNSSIERFHRYLTGALTILYDRKTPNWDRLIPPVLFAYRASRNDATGYSPFYLSTGIEPTLPMNVLFGDFSEAKDEGDFANRIAGELKAAFGHARKMQTDAAERNKARSHKNRYTPMFEPGDFLYVWERSKAESRLLEADSAPSDLMKQTLPRKLTNPWIGPYRMIEWKGERHCALDVKGTATTYNVNRLTKQYFWDGVCKDTGKAFQKPSEAELDFKHGDAKEADSVIEQSKAEEVKEGHIIIFPMEMSDDHPCPFGVGRVLDVTDKSNLHFQWLGNAKYNATSSFKPAWFQESDKTYYYSQKPIHHSHPAYTGRMSLTKEVAVSSDDVMASGFDLVSKDRLSLRARKAIMTAGLPEWSAKEAFTAAVQETQEMHQCFRPRCWMPPQ